MKSLIFAKRNIKELIRDPLSIAFGMALPLILLLLMSYIGNSASVEIFDLKYFAPGIAVFSFSFLTLFGATLIANDRASSFLTRLYSSPMKSKDYILGYSIALIPIGIIQSIVTFGTSILLGLPFNINIIYTILILIPISLLFISLGLLIGSLCKASSAPGIGSIIVQVMALSSGMWFDLNTIGGSFKTICYLLPFSHALEITKIVLNNINELLTTHFIWIICYTLVITILAIISFKKSTQK